MTHLTRLAMPVVLSIHILRVTYVFIVTESIQSIRFGKYGHKSEFLGSAHSILRPQKAAQSESGLETARPEQADLS